MSSIMRKPFFCTCKNKDADQLCGDRTADQRLCFRYIDSTIPLLLKSEISSLQPSSVAVQPGLCRTWSETLKTFFSHNEAQKTCPMGFRSGPTQTSLIRYSYENTVKFLYFRTPENLAEIYLKFKKRGQISGYFIKKVLME